MDIWLKWLSLFNVYLFVALLTLNIYTQSPWWLVAISALGVGVFTLMAYVLWVENR